jgi:hypothetical protein
MDQIYCGREEREKREKQNSPVPLILGYTYGDRVLCNSPDFQ